MRIELLKQIFGVPRPNNQFHVRAADERAQELKLEVAGQSRKRADPQRLPSIGGAFAQSRQEFVARLKDRVGIVQGDLPPPLSGPAAARAAQKADDRSGVQASVFALKVLIATNAAVLRPG